MSGRYRTIVADPPWAYDGFASHFGRKDQGVHPLPYDAMTLDQIASLPVADFADPAGARLFLWTTNRYLPAAFGILNQWGFDYAQTLTWHKTGNPSPFGGSVAPIHAEFLLVAKRGEVPVSGRWPTSVVAAPKPIRDHSQKPDVFLDLVELVSPSPWLEMFSRRARFGWDTWGNESLHGGEAA